MELETERNNKHAYLIMAHKQFETLEKVLQLLDDARNDFYVHIDKKLKTLILTILPRALRIPIFISLNA